MEFGNPCRKLVSWRARLVSSGWSKVRDEEGHGASSWRFCVVVGGRSDSRPKSCGRSGSRIIFWPCPRPPSSPPAPPPASSSSAAAGSSSSSSATTFIRPSFSCPREEAVEDDDEEDLVRRAAAPGLHVNEGQFVPSRIQRSFFAAYLFGLRPRPRPRPRSRPSPGARTGCGDGGLRLHEALPARCVRGFIFLMLRTLSQLRRLCGAIRPEL